MPAGQAVAENPKEGAGSAKLPLAIWPSAATAVGSLAMLHGALKYGYSNYRATEIWAMTYLNALERHIASWKEGQENDPDSKVPHLGHALACIAIIVDARAAGKFVDDRPAAGGYIALAEELSPLVAEIKADSAGRSPRHYYIGDGAAAPAAGPDPCGDGHADGTAAPAAKPDPCGDGHAWRPAGTKFPARGVVWIRWPSSAPGEGYHGSLLWGEDSFPRVAPYPTEQWRYLTPEEYAEWAEAEVAVSVFRPPSRSPGKGGKGP